jgi:hypothetical protein
VMVVNILYNHWCSFMVSFNHRKLEAQPTEPVSLTWQ